MSMSCWAPLSEEDAVKCAQVFTRKPEKINAVNRLQVINALDNGHPKMDIAREYGVHPNTIASIYKQKDTIIKKYKQKLISLKDVRSMNLDVSLLEWFRLQNTQGNVVYENLMFDKAREILSTSNEDFDCLDEWLEDFCLRHNIVKHSIEPYCSSEDREQWLKLIEGVDLQDVYVGGTCPLYHTFELDKYLEGEKAESYASIFFTTNCSGSDKLELLVVGDEPLQCTSVTSVPVDYCHRSKPVLKCNNIVNYLLKWDRKLSDNKRHVALVLDLPKTYLEQMHFSNITLIHTGSKNELIRKSCDKIVLCFKHHYRRLQISRFFRSSKKMEHRAELYLQLLSLAWYNVSNVYIQRLFDPPHRSNLHLHDNRDVIECVNFCSLSEWSESCELPLEPKAQSMLDEFVMCDRHLPTLDQYGDSTDVKIAIKRKLPESAGSSSVEAYQAMKRLISYIHGQNAQSCVLESARSLEDMLEFGAIAEIQQKLSENSTNDISE